MEKLTSGYQEQVKHLPCIAAFAIGFGWMNVLAQHLLFKKTWAFIVQPARLSPSVLLGNVPPFAPVEHTKDPSRNNAFMY